MRETDTGLMDWDAKLKSDYLPQFFISRTSSVKKNGKHIQTIGGIIMGSIRSILKFRFIMLWTILCVSIFLFIVPGSAQAKKVFNPQDTPWETPEGRACFEQWIREAIAKIKKS